LSSCSSNAAGKATTSGNATIKRCSMISRLSGSVYVVSGCSLRCKACRQVARDESHDIDRRRAATGLARARARPAQMPGVGVPSAVAWRCGAGANHGAGHGSARRSCASALGARPRVVQTEKRKASGDRQRVRERSRARFADAREGVCVRCAFPGRNPKGSLCIFRFCKV